MYKCHLCNLETKQLNGLMSRHYVKRHPTITREQYKIDVLIANGRPQGVCKVCNKPTIIAKGDDKYPAYHQKCYLTTMLAGENNPNWKGGKQTVICTLCKEQRSAYSSHLEGQNDFCSVSCSTKFYSLPDNQSEAMKAKYVQAGEQFKRLWKNPTFREKQALSLAAQGKRRRSKVEEQCFEVVKQLHSDAVASHLVKYYTFDMFIPSRNLLIEFDGTYWHSLPITVSLDKRKTTYINKYHKQFSLIRIPEKEWYAANDKLIYLKSKLTAPN